MKKRWSIHDTDITKIQKISRQLNIHQVTAAILINRGFINRTDIDIFLNPQLENIGSYDKLVDIDKAVNRITDAILRKQKILVFGDYDVDGVTSTAILFDFLKKSGANAAYYIPHRVTEGYGLKKDHIANIAKPNEINLIITVDCGSANHEAVEFANESGIDVIITDHHQISVEMPNACAVINPCRHDCPSACSHLSGVGVAFYLLICLRKHLRENNFWDINSQPNLKEYCDLVALGTISDIVPMVLENRVISKAGIDVINSNPRPGISALIESSGINKPYIDADDIAYRLGPRINAAGRMAHARVGVELLLSEDTVQASFLADELSRLNSLRQKEETLIFDRIVKFLKEEPALLKNKALVLSGNDLHEGVIGIVASRLSEKFHRPTILISFKNELGKGSGRGIPGIDLYEAVAACSSYLENFGGHPMAAGLTIKPENYIKFKNSFEKIVEKLMADVVLEPCLEIDAQVDFDVISDKLVSEIESLQPFGPFNPEPILMSRNVDITFSKKVGLRHQRLMLRQKRNPKRTIPAIWFNADSDLLEKRHFKELAYKLRKNHWNGNQNIQILVEDAR